MEQWRDIKGYEGLYQVSSYGNIRSLDRRAVNHKCGATRIVRGIVINPWDNGNGYLVVTLSNGRKRRNRYVHRLVAETFLDNPKSKKYVNHKDYDTHNNRADNLEWCTQMENVNYSICNMRKPKTKSRPTNTGEKYISRRIQRGKYVSYRVVVKIANADKSFKTLEAAISYRNEVMRKWQNQ
jgi:hypothetical protein